MTADVGAARVTAARRDATGSLRVDAVDRPLRPAAVAKRNAIVEA
jgi:hypothetical protein